MNPTITRRGLVSGAAATGAMALGLRGMTPERALARLAALQDGAVAIDYWHRSTGAAAEAWETLATAFNAEYAGQVEVTPIAQGTIQELNQKVRAAAAGVGCPARSWPTTTT